MDIYITILVEFIFVSASILFLFKLRPKLGLAPLYILLGSIQYFLANIGGKVHFQFLDVYTIYPGSVILFSAILFGVLLIYIKEGVSSAKSLIIGVIISNCIVTILFSLTHTQELIINELQQVSDSLNSVFKINYKIFIIGNFILLLDFLVLIVVYQFLISKIKTRYFFFILFLSLFTVLMFDSILFNVLLFYNSIEFKSFIIGHVIGKSIASLVFAFIMYIYLKVVDKETMKATFIANQQRGLFSIISTRKKIKNLEIEKNEIEKKLISRLETTLDKISDGFISLDTNWCYTYINKKAGELLGRSPNDLLGKHIWTEFPERVGLPLYNIYNKVFETQKTHYYQEYNELLDRWIENRIYPSYQGVTVYFTDITEQKKAERLIVKNEKYLNNIINNIGDPIFVKDEQSRLLLVNNAFCNIFNLNRDEILGKTLAEDVDIEERESFLKIDKHVLSSGIENINEERLSVKGEATHIISTKKSRFFDDNGNKFLIGIIRDISERIKSEEKIIENEEKFSKAFESNVMGKAILNKDKKIIEINEALTSIVGLKREDMLEKTAKEIGFFKMDNQINIDNENLLWNAFSKDGYVSNKELKYLLHTGEELFLSISLQTLLLNNEDHILITVLDITEKKNAETELEKYRSNLEELVKTRTEEVNSKNAELQRMNKLFVGRELKMKELKSIIKEMQLKNDK